MDDDLHRHEAEDPTEPPQPPADTGVEVLLVVPAPAYESVVTETSAAPTPVETGPAVGPAPTDTSAVERLGDRLDRRLDELKAMFEREIRAEATREKVVDRLHAELQEYKQDLLLNTLRPVFIDLIQLHDDMGKVAATPDDDSGDDLKRLAALMDGFRRGIEDILYRQGVEPFAVDGEAFDPRRQRAVSTVPTDDPALNKTVAARLRKGFRSGERVIRAEIVSVYSVRK